jgi:excisionase family DNA binding protein
MKEIFLTVTQAARILELSAESVRSYEKKGLLPALKTGKGMRLFRKQDVENFRSDSKRAKKESA